MERKNIPVPVIPDWAKLYNTYDPEYYAPGKRVSAEEWNTLFLASVYQGNYNADTLDLLINIYLPDVFNSIETRVKDVETLTSDTHTLVEKAYGYASQAYFTSEQSQKIAKDAEETAKTALDHIIQAIGTAVTVGGELVPVFDADTKADLVYVDKRFEDLIGAAPETLDTLEEVSKAFAENKDVVDALNIAIGKKADKTELPTIDSVLSVNSTNPVQNRVIAEAINDALVEIVWWED